MVAGGEIVRAQDGHRRPIVRGYAVGRRQQKVGRDHAGTAPVADVLLGFVVGRVAEGGHERELAFARLLPVDDVEGQSGRVLGHLFAGQPGPDAQRARPVRLAADHLGQAVEPARHAVGEAAVLHDHLQKPGTVGRIRADAGRTIAQLARISLCGAESENE